MGSAVNPCVCILSAWILIILIAKGKLPRLVPSLCELRAMPTLSVMMIKSLCVVK